MNEIVRRMWDRETNTRKWSEENGFCPGYVHQVIAGKRGKLKVGKTKRILVALVEQGFATSEEVGL